jgi:pyruvate kinase
MIVKEAEETGKSEEKRAGSLRRLPSNKTKIVCTIGPSSSSPQVIADLIKSGMNVARLNFSHGTNEEHRELIRSIRTVASRLGRTVAILIDLPGPKIRIGRLIHEPVILKKGETITLTTDPASTDLAAIPVNYPPLPSLVNEGTTIFLNDGFLQVKVIRISGLEVVAKVVIGGPLLSHKGLNLPGITLPIAAVTPEDLIFVDLGLDEGVDTFTISFLEHPEDIRTIREYAERRGAKIHIVAKIERAGAVRSIDAILAEADAIMIARGDLGVQIPIEEVPGVQKRCILKANRLGVPVITATQMLESMTENVLPTRAEVTDVANAILDGTDAVMLSAETATGKYPVETVQMMAKIARTIEAERITLKGRSRLEEELLTRINRRELTIDDVVSLNVIQAMHALSPRYILTPTRSGRTPRRISRFKPDCWVLSFCRDERVSEFLTFSYGVMPFFVKTDDVYWHDRIFDQVRDAGLAKTGDLVILTEGTSPDEVGTTNALRIIKLP